ncbi:MAG: DNA/RNA non-specific endonuclease [Phycisphaerales bacterium]|nr:MAG: DNA/RNA non-specific endonuclease [Phycisphaerales bacterium]
MSRMFIAVPALVGILSAGALRPQTDNPRIQVHRRPAVITAMESWTDDDLTNEQLRLLQTHCPLGRPRLTTDLYGTTWLVVHEGYVLELSAIDKIPLWVGEEVTSDQLGDAAERAGRFKLDPIVPRHVQARHEDYTNTGYDRGHQAAAADFSADQELMDETFRVTNIAPQEPDLNQQAWKALEMRIRDWIGPNQPAYIITGPIFHDPREEGDGERADGLVEYYTVGPGGVSVPTHFYKIVLQWRDEAWNAIGFVMENADPGPVVDLSDYRRSIRWIEEHTGLDFFDQLDQDEQDDLEIPVAAMWQ